MHEGEVSARLGLTGWPAVAEEAIIARDCLLAAHVGSRAARLPRLHRRLRRDHPLGQGASGVGGSPPRSPRTTCCSPTSWPPATTRCSRSTRRCAPRADVAALRAGLADGTIDCVATDHAPHPVEDKECEWAAAALGMIGLETALSRGAADDGRDRAARLGRGRRPDVARARPRSAGLRRPRAARSAVGAAGQPHPGRPGGPRGRSTRRAHGQPEPQHARSPGWSCRAGWSRRSCAAGRPCSTGSCGPAGRTAGADRRRPAVLVLEDGRTVPRRRRSGRVGETVRRGGLQHRHDRLPGDADRPVLPPPDRGDDRAAHRQHRGRTTRTPSRGGSGWPATWSATRPGSPRTGGPPAQLEDELAAQGVVGIAGSTPGR